MDPQQQAVLQQLNRPGWKVTGQRPETTSVQGPPDAYGQPSKVEQPTGNQVWVITGPGGQSDEIVVKPPTAPNVPYENPNDPGAKPGVASYTIVQGPKANVQQPSATAGWTDVKGITNGGVTTYYGRDPADGKFKPVPGLPTETAGKTTATPVPADQLQTINDPTTGKPIKLRDPSTGTVIDLPNDATVSKPQIVNGAGGALYSWDGTTLTLRQAGTPIEPKPAEGQTRQNVAGGYAVQEVYRGGNWVTDPSVAPKPYDPALAGKPKEGDLRPNTDNKGQAIQEIFKGGSWVTDTSTPPRAFGNQAPTTLNTGTGPFIAQQNPTTGAIAWQPNRNTTDVAARVGQLQELARAQRDTLQQAVQSGAKTPEQAAADFDTWWSSNIDPVSQELQRSQQQTTYDAQQKQQAAEQVQQQADTSSLNVAQQAGRDAVAAYTAIPSRDRVGPGYGQAFANAYNSWKTGKPAPDITPDAVTYNAPDLQAMAQQATAAALAHISPTAAQIAGRPPPRIPQGLDVAGALNKSNYSPTTTIAPDGTVTIQHQPAPPPAAPTPDFAAMSVNDPARVFGNYTMPPQFSPAAPPF